MSREGYSRSLAAAIAARLVHSDPGGVVGEACAMAMGEALMRAGITDNVENLSATEIRAATAALHESLTDAVIAQSRSVPQAIDLFSFPIDKLADASRRAGLAAVEAVVGIRSRRGLN